MAVELTSPSPVDPKEGAPSPPGTHRGPWKPQAYQPYHQLPKPLQTHPGARTEGHVPALSNTYLRRIRLDNGYVYIPLNIPWPDSF